MNKFLSLLILLLTSGLLISTAAFCEDSASNFTEAQQQMDEITAALSRNVDRFEDIKNRLMALGQANADYDEQKNIWLSAMLSLSAIGAICEYENDLLTLFMELKEKNRKHFYDVRRMSLETSIEQITIMNRQIEINHALITHVAKEQKFISAEKDLILSSISLLRKSLDVINSLHP